MGSRWAGTMFKTNTKLRNERRDGRCHESWWRVIWISDEVSTNQRINLYINYGSQIRVLSFCRFVLLYPSSRRDLLFLHSWSILNWSGDPEYFDEWWLMMKYIVIYEWWCQFPATPTLRFLVPPALREGVLWGLHCARRQRLISWPGGRNAVEYPTSPPLPSFLLCPRSLHHSQHRSLGRVKGAMPALFCVKIRWVLGLEVVGWGQM